MAERYDFATGRWTHDDATAPVRTAELPAPQIPPREGRWRGPERRATTAWPYLLALVGMILLMFAALWTRNRPLILVTLVGMAVGMPIVACAGQRKEWSPREEDARLLEDPDDRDACLVEIEVFASRPPKGLLGDFGPAGTDRGVAWFEGGALHYSGHRTSFVVGGEDVLPKGAWDLDYDMLKLSGLALTLRTPLERAFLRILPLTGQEADRTERFDRRLDAFRWRPTPSDGRPRQWPPFTRESRTP